MLERLKSLVLKASIVGLLFAPVVPATVMAQGAAPTDPAIKDQLCKGANLSVTGNADCTENGEAASTVDDLIADVINIFSLVVGVVSVIMIIIGGFKYITSGGDSGNVTGAKNTILSAVIGLVIVALAQILVKFVLSQTSNTGS